MRSWQHTQLPQSCPKCHFCTLTSSPAWREEARALALAFAAVTKCILGIRSDNRQLFVRLLSCGDQEEKGWIRRAEYPLVS